MFHIKTAYLGLGSNLGNKIKNLSEALDLLESNGVIIIKKSSIYQTPPWGFEAKEDFLNMVIEVNTQFLPYELLRVLKSIEKNMGRKEKISNTYSSRIIDVDILDYNNQVLNSDKLSFPHKHLHQRNFVLLPLQEINNNWIHPETKVKINTLVKAIKQNDIKIINN